jgi:phosphate transport system substrate-binding protein
MKSIIPKPYRSVSGIFLRSFSLILLGLIASSCSQSNPPSESSETPVWGKVTIRGSNTFGEELGPRLIAEYKKARPAASFDLETKGTSYGFGALSGGFCDIAGASRQPLKEELEVAQFRNVEFNDHIIGAYSVAVVVNAGNPVGDLTPAQVRDIFTGVVTNWAAVGGPDAPVHLFARDPVSGTYLGFRELAMENKPYASTPNLFTNYTAITAAVAQDANGIGYSSIELEKSAGVKPVSIGGVEPSAETVNNGKYPYTRTLHLYTRKGNESPAALDFIQFVQSEAGQKVLAEMGDTPLAKVSPSSQR